MKTAILFLFIITLWKYTHTAEFKQNDYHIISDRLVVDKEYKEWVDFTVTNTKYNRTQRTFSAVINIRKAVHPSRIMVGYVF